MIQKFYLFLQRLKGKFLEELPRDAAALDSFILSTLRLYNLPTDKEHFRAVANAIQQATQGGSHKVSKYAVYSFITRAMAMRTAFVKIQDINKAEKPEPLIEAPEIPGN